MQGRKEMSSLREMNARTPTCNYFQRVVSQDPIPEEKQLVRGEIAGEGPHHPLEGYTQPEDRTPTCV